MLGQRFLDGRNGRLLVARLLYPVLLFEPAPRVTRSRTEPLPPPRPVM